jgi:hypothetical protein
MLGRLIRETNIQGIVFSDGRSAINEERLPCDETCIMPRGLKTDLYGRIRGFPRRKPAHLGNESDRRRQIPSTQRSSVTEAQTHNRGRRLRLRTSYHLEPVAS